MDGQKRLKNARVLLIGAGGLGAPNAMYLAAAGVATSAWSTSTWSTPPTSSGRSSTGPPTSAAQAGERPRQDHRDQPVRAGHPARDPAVVENARELVRDYDLVVDGSDNFPTRYLVNDACVLEGKPYVWGSIYRFDGQASVFWAEHGPATCAPSRPRRAWSPPAPRAGAGRALRHRRLGPGQRGREAALWQGRPLVGRLLIYDALELSFKDIAVRKDPECAVCGRTLRSPS